MRNKDIDMDSRRRESHIIRRRFPEKPYKSTYYSH
jgi:hypothetical protein